MQETQQPTLRRPAHLQIPEVLLSSPSCSTKQLSSPFPWSSPCSIIHGFPDSPLPSPVPPASSARDLACGAAPPNRFILANPNPIPDSVRTTSDYSSNAVICPKPYNVFECPASDNSILVNQRTASDFSVSVNLYPNFGKASCNDSVLVNANPNPDFPGLVLRLCSVNQHSSPSLNPQPLLRPRMLSRLRHSTSLTESASPIMSYSAPASPPPTSSSHERSGREGWEAFRAGTFVFVRCNQSKWLLGQVRRCANSGVIVWVGSAQVMVNVPFALLSTHLALFGDSNSIHQAQGCHDSFHDAAEASMQSKIHLPPPFSYSSSCPCSPVHNIPASLFANSYSNANPSPNPNPSLKPCPNSSLSSGLYCAFCIVRPAHLSHRQLYKPATQKHITYNNPSINIDHLPQLDYNTGELSHSISPTLQQSSINTSLIKNQLSLNTSQSYLKNQTILANSNHFSYQKSPSIINVGTAMEPMISSNSPSSCSNYVRNPIKDTPRVHKATLMRSLSLPPTRPKEPRCHGVVRTKELYHQVVQTKEQTEASLALTTSTQNAASSALSNAADCEGLVPSNHDDLYVSMQGNLQDYPLQNIRARRCKSLGNLAGQQVWYTVIENGLHTRKKKNLQEDLHLLN